MFDDPVKANSNFPLIASNDIHGKKKTRVPGRLQVTQRVRFPSSRGHIR